MKKTFYLLDGSAITYRSHFAFIRNPLLTSKGFNSSAVFGFLGTINRLLQEEHVDLLAVAMDTKEPTFRHELYPEYKATRQKMPDDLVAQLPYIDRLIDGLRIPRLAVPGIEADDIIASLSLWGKAQGYEVFIVSGDKDFTQLVQEGISILSLNAQERTVIGVPQVLEKYGVHPERMLDYFAIVGDASDNVPGIKGMGPVKAKKYINTYHTLDNLLAHADELTGQDKLSVANGKENALLSRRLISLKCDVDLGLGERDFLRTEPDQEQLAKLYAELEFSNLQASATKKSQETNETQTSQGLRNYHTVQNRAELDTLIAKLSKADFFVFDTETTGLEHMTAEIVGMSFSMSPNEAYYVPFNQIPPIAKTSELLAALQPLFANERIAKGGQNMKYDLHILANAGVEVGGVSFDTLIAAFLIHPTMQQKNLDALALHYFNMVKIPTSALLTKGVESMAQLPVAQVAEYACEDADVTFRLSQIMRRELKEQNLAKIFHETEMPLLQVLLAMERRGITVDVPKLRSLSKELQEKMFGLEKQIYETAGEAFNINSPKQLSVILFEKLKVHEALGKRLKKTKTGYSTDVGVLEDLSEHPLPRLILDYRSFAKLKSTYVDSLPNMVNTKTGRIHTSFSQTIAATGRLSSVDPNLQNIPIRTSEGRRIRECFIADSSEYVLLSADYSQVELRILAHLSHEENLISAFQRDEDIHRQTASLVFSVPLSEVTKSMRDQAKVINFGIIYGMGPQRLAKENGISMQEAKQFIESYFASYTGIKRYIDSQIASAKATEAVYTMLGRRRNISEINSGNKMLEVSAEHIAVNTPIQGSAADLIKVAMINIQRRLKESALHAHMLLQVHDELVFSVRKDCVEQVSALVREEMEHALPLLVPLKVEIGVGANWLEAH